MKIILKRLMSSLSLALVVALLGIALTGRVVAQAADSPPAEQNGQAVKEVDKDADSLNADRGEETSGEREERDAEGEDADADADGDDDGDGETKSTSVKLDGVFQAVHAAGVRIDLDQWTSLTVVDAVAHGDKVQVGDVLIQLETDKLQDAIDAAKHEIDVEELALADADIKLELAGRRQKLALKAAGMSDRIATDDLKEFITSGRDRKLSSLDRSVKSARDRLDYQAEELKQLERMYAADDLTEETEEIILKRTRNGVEAMEYGLGLVLQNRRRGIELDVPRTELQLEASVADLALALEEARRTAPQDLERQRLRYKKRRKDLENKKSRLGRLRADLKRMTVVAPRSGVVYYGSLRRGNWSNPSTIEAMLRPGGSPKTRTDLITVVELRPLNVRVTVPEKSLRHVAAGTSVTIEAVAFPDEEITGSVVQHSTIPVAPGKFDAVVNLNSADLPAGVVPGMKAKITIQTQEDE